MSTAALTELLTVDEVARSLAVSRSTVRRWIRNGDLPAFKLGDGRASQVRVAPAAVLRFVTTRGDAA